jgi:chemotaxis regulatin CheY-phosphate phosphatase CheZ
MVDNKSKMTDQIRQELKELTDSINTMMEAFRQIKKPMQESSVKLPTSAYQLERVTEQTEQATHKVLDMVESISNRETNILEDSKKIKGMIPQEVLDSSSELATLIAKISANAEANLNDSYNIMDALQFQDITTQQIDYAISLLDDVEGKLHIMLKAVGIKQEQGQQRMPKREKAFDPNASFAADNPSQQKEIDNIIKGME